MTKKDKYTVKASMNFSIGEAEFYLTKGETAELPEHPHIASLVRSGYLEKQEHMQAKQDEATEETKEPAADAGSKSQRTNKKK